MAVRNIGIFAHVDAGKTTLSEQLLLRSGSIRQAGSVDRGTAHTDTLPVERRRGISVKATSVSLTWKGTEIRLIDTPGHTDFSAKIERSLWAVDAAVLVIDAAQGVQPQTEALHRAFVTQGLPFLIFLNKMDRPGADADRVLRQIARRLTDGAVPLWDGGKTVEAVCESDEALTVRYLEGDYPSKEELRKVMLPAVRKGRLVPVLRGSALRNEGVDALLDAVVDWLPGPEADGGELCGVAFAADRDKLMGRGLWVRLFGGRMGNRMPVEIRSGRDPATGEDRWIQRKITQIRGVDGRDLGTLKAGDVGVLYGLGDLEIGHVFGRAELLPRRVQPGLFRTPLITVQVKPEKPEQMQALREACDVLASEDPLLHVSRELLTGEVHLQAMGKIQLEILQELLASRFGVPAGFSDPSVIYRETIRQEATGFVAYTMPKPCCAVLEFDIRPGKRGSGITYRSCVAARDILPRYQHQVEQALPLALEQGRRGWQVTDVEITLTGGNYHAVHTHPLDFILATPMAIQDGLRRGGSVLLEPILEIRFILPAECIGRVIGDVQLMRGEVLETDAQEDTVALTALVPVASSMDYPSVFASVTGGRGSMSTALHSWRECPPELGADAPRRGVDPLDTARYILAARSALESNIW